MSNRGFIGIGVLLAVLLGLIVVGGGAYYVMHQSAAPGAQPNYPDLSNTQQPATSNQTQPSTVQAIQTQQQNSAPSATNAQVVNQSHLSVSGMSEYTDTNFGFTLWYPTSWTLKQVPVSNPSAYIGGTIENAFQISGGNYQGAEIEEYHSDNMTITIPESNCPAGDGCPAQRIYFSPTDHAWMVEYPNGGNGVAAGASVPANVSHNTMGGLHIISGLARFNALGIIPLSAENFLIVSDQNNVATDLLVQTIVATNPAVATPESLNAQSQLVHREGVTLGAIGTSIDNGTWYKDSQYVYDSQGNIVNGANPATFEPINTYSDGHTTTESFFATDGVNVYCGGEPSTDNYVLQGADPATFVMIRTAFQTQQQGTGAMLTFYNTHYEKDKSHVWDGCKLVPNADPNTFVAGNDMNVVNGVLIMAHDANHTYGEDIKGNVTVDGVSVTN